MRYSQSQSCRHFFLKSINLITFIFFGTIWATAFNPNPKIDSLKVTNFKKYGIKDGLINNCIESAFIDIKGRLWLNPCLNTAQSLGVNFFQFDGAQSILHELDLNWDSGKSLPSVWRLHGITGNGFLFGYSEDYSSIFYWNPDTGKRQFVKLTDSEYLINIVDDESNGIIVVLYKDRGYLIKRITEDNVEILGSLQLATNTSKLTHLTSINIENQILRFLHERDGLVEFDLRTGKLEFLPWSLMGINHFIKQSDLDFYGAYFNWRIVTSSSHKSLLYLGQKNGFFNYNHNSKKLTVAKLYNDRILPHEQDSLKLKVLTKKDKVNNLLIISSYVEYYEGVTIPFAKNFKATLIDNEGNWIDYSPLFAQSPNSIPIMQRWDRDEKFFGRDFKREIGWTTDTDMTILKVNPGFKIKTINQGIGQRSIIEIDSLNLFVNTDSSFTHLDIESGLSSNVSNEDFLINGLSPLYERDNKIWMSLQQGGLAQYDLNNKSFSYINIDLIFEKFVFLNDEEIALFSKKGALYKYNLINDSLSPYMNQNKPFNIEGYVNDLLLTEDNNLWVASHNGLWQIDLNSEQIFHLDFKNYLDNPSIICIGKGLSKQIWLGTATSGVLIYDTNSKKTKQINEVLGLSNNTVAGILADNGGNRWVSTYNGITVLNAKGTVLFKLNKADGLINQEFNRTSYAKLRDGLMIFGGVSGIDIFYPDQILETFEASIPLQIYFTDLEYYDSKKDMNILKKNLFISSDVINIPATNRFLKLDFALSEYNQLNSHSYSYRLLPNNSNKNISEEIPWVNLGSTSQALIYNLPTGDHLVQVRAMDQNSRQVSEILKVQIHVQEYFYRTWWYYSLCTFVIFFSSWIWIRRLLTEKKRLQVEVEKRTSEIQKDKILIEQQSDKLRELDLVKSRFFTNISHEFRTPLTVIVGMAGQIKDQIHIRKLIQRNAKILLRLINQILELTKLESIGAEPQLIRGDIITFIRNITESFQSLANEKGVMLKFEVQPEELVLNYDQEKLLHIISNLLTNAIKFTLDGGEVKIRVEPPKDKNASVYQILVSDTGTGIAEEKIKHIFDRFYQVDDEISRTGSGTGIGLALVQELVKLLSGEISVESKLKVGTTFKVQLPFTQNAKFVKDSMKVNMHLVEMADKFSDQKVAEKMNENELPTLLIAEDNRDVAEYIFHYLKENYRLLYASNGQEGIEMVIEHVPDIILSDVMMPKVDGFTLCHTLKLDIRTSHIPIILLTAKVDIESRIKGLQLGADAYLAKPFNEKELKVQLQNLLQLRLKLQQRYASTENLEPTEDFTIQQEDQFVLNAREVILEHMNQENFGVLELSKLLFMSRTQLHNKIKSLTNKSTSHFIRLIRIEKACQLLQESDLNISQISLEIGIDSLPYFSRIFTEYIGVSPNKFREKHKKNNRLNN